MPPLDRTMRHPHLQFRCLRTPLTPISSTTSSSTLARPDLPSILTRSRTQHQQTRGIKSTYAPRPNRFNHNPHLPPLLSTSTAATARLRASQTLPPRTGLLAIKKGMISHYDTITGNRIPCTVLQLDRCQVLAHKRGDIHGYWAVQVGSGWKHPDNVSRPMLGHFAGAKVAPKRWITEFRVDGESALPAVGKQLLASHFKVDGFVDTRSTSKGKGFAGGMKRHGMSGQPASHGQSLMHRGMGSAGAGQGSGSRVLPGKRMPGRMGGEQSTVQNLRVVSVDGERGILVLGGAVAGPKGCVVKVQDALKKPWPEIEDEAEEIIQETAATPNVIPDAPAAASAQPVAS